MRTTLIAKTGFAVGEKAVPTNGTALPESQAFIKFERSEFSTCGFHRTLTALSQIQKFPVRHGEHGKIRRISRMQLR